MYAAKIGKIAIQWVGEHCQGLAGCIFQRTAQYEGAFEGVKNIGDTNTPGCFQSGHFTQTFTFQTLRQCSDHVHVAVPAVL